MAFSRVLAKTDSCTSEPEALLNVELVRQASSRVADPESLVCGDAVYEFAEENLEGFKTLFPQLFEEQAAASEKVALTWASACSGSEGAFYVMEALSRAYKTHTNSQLEVSLTHLFSCENNKDKQMWIQTVLEVGCLKSPVSDLVSDVEAASSAFGSVSHHLFDDIQKLGDIEAPCVCHGQLCDVPSCDIFVVGSSCKDFSKANPKKETQKLVFHQESSLGGSAQTYQGFTKYVAAHAPSLIVYENVDGLEEQIGSTEQSNLDVIMRTMAQLGYKGQPVRTDAAAFGLPARRRRLYILFVRKVNPKVHTEARSLTKSFDMFNHMVASCVRSPPCATRVLLNSASGEVFAFLDERRESRAQAASKAAKSSSSWTEQHMKFAENEGLRWGQPYPEALKLNAWFETLTEREQDVVVLSRAQAPDAGFRNVPQTLGRVNTISYCQETKKHLAPTMLPGQILFVEVAKPPRIMLGREALIFQGFPVEPFLKQVADEHIDIHQPARKGKSSKRSTQSRK